MNLSLSNRKTITWVALAPYVHPLLVFVILTTNPKTDPIHIESGWVLVRGHLVQTYTSPAGEETTKCHLHILSTGDRILDPECGMRTNPPVILPS